VDGVAARYGRRGVSLVQSVGADDSKFLLQRYFHLLESPGAWQLDELAKLKQSSAFPRLRKELATLSQQISQELEADGKSATFTELLADLSVTREKSNAKLSRWVDETIDAMGAFSEMAIRRDYEAKLGELRDKCLAHMRRARWRSAAVRALKLEASNAAKPAGSSGGDGGGNGNGKDGSFNEGGGGGGHAKEPRSKRVARLTVAASLLARRHEDRSLAFALWAHAERRRLTGLYKSATPPPLRHYIYVLNLQRYGDPIGLGWDSACGKYHGEWDKIITAASRPNGGVDALLKGFRVWLLLQSGRYMREARLATFAWKRSDGDAVAHEPSACGWLRCCCVPMQAVASHTARLSAVGREAARGLRASGFSRVSRARPSPRARPAPPANVANRSNPAMSTQVV